MDRSFQLQMWLLGLTPWLPAPVHLGERTAGFEVFHQYVYRGHDSKRQRRGHHQAAEDHGAQGLLAVGGGSIG